MKIETGELVFMQAIAFFDDDLARIDDAFGVELPIAGFFNAPTIADLAGLVEQKLLDEIARERDKRDEDS